MSVTLAFIVAFLFGLYVAFNDLFSSTPIYFAFAKKSPALWLLGVIYGGFSMVFLFLLKESIVDISVEIGAARRPLPGGLKIWASAIFAGLSVKSLMGTSFYNFRYDGDKTFPLGPATFVRIFEPQIIQAILTDHYIAMDNFLDNARQRTSGLSFQDIRDVICNKAFARFPDDSSRNSFILDLGDAHSTDEALALYLKTFGKKIFCHTFPACKN